MGVEKNELASVIISKNSPFSIAIENDKVILKEDRQSFPMVPKSGRKVIIIIKIFYLKTISHFSLCTM